MSRQALWSALLFFLVLANFFGPAYSQDKVRLRYGTTISLHNLPIWVAKSKGLFEKYGLDIEVILVRGGTLNIMGILADRLQLSSVGAEAVVAARAKGSDVAILACAADTDLVYLITRPDIKGPADLKGKTSAVTRLGGTIHFYLRTALKHFGLDPKKDMTILQLGRGSDIAAALDQRQIAVAALPYTYALPLLDKGWPVLLELNQAGLKYPPACVVSTRSYIRHNSRVVDSFLKAYVEAIYRIKTDPSVGEDVYIQLTREDNRGIVKRAISLYAKTFHRVPYASDKGIETVLTDLASRSPVPKELSGHPEYFRDNEPLEKIEKSGFIEKLYKP